MRGLIMKLSIQQQAIKKYIDNAHTRGRKPSIREVAEAFKITPDQVRGALRAIKKHKRSNPFYNADVPDFFKDIFDL